MAENIYELLKNEQPALAAKLDTNHDVCEFLYAAYAHILQMAIDSPKDPKNMMCLVSIEADRLLKLQLRYYESGHNQSSNLTKIPAKRNLSLVSLLQSNSNLKSVAQRVTEILEKWVDSHPATKAQGFTKIKCRESTLWRGSMTITSELVTKFEFDDYVNAKMQWDMPEDESSEVKEQVQ